MSIVRHDPHAEARSVSIAYDPRKRVYLDVPFDKITLAKRRLAAQFDPQRRQWYTLAEVALRESTTVKRFLPRASDRRANVHPGRRRSVAGHVCPQCGGPGNDRGPLLCWRCRL